MKHAVHTLREQLRKKTRRPAVNSVLKAAYEEIQVIFSVVYYNAYCPKINYQAFWCTSIGDSMYSAVKKRAVLLGVFFKDAFGENSQLYIYHLSRLHTRL